MEVGVAYSANTVSPDVRMQLFRTIMTFELESCEKSKKQCMNLKETGSAHDSVGIL
jgi:hypothetical protein